VSTRHVRKAGGGTTRIRKIVRVLPRPTPKMTLVDKGRVIRRGIAPSGPRQSHGR
jgi:hypothetical protein